MKDITIVIPCFNQSIYLEQAVSSCLSSSLMPKEIIVICMDESSHLLIPKLQSLSPIISCYKKDRMFTSTARNFGFSKVSTEWVLPLDADDKISSSMLSEFDKYSTGDVLHGYAKAFGDLKNWWREWPTPVISFTLEDIKKYDPIPSCSLVKYSVWKAVGGYNENLTVGCEDWEFWLNIKKHGFDFTPCSQAYYWYRVSPNSRDHQAKLSFNCIVDQIKKIHSDIF